MRNARLLSAACLSSILAFACATGPTIRVDRDPGADMSAYKTFAFFDPLATDRTQYSTLVSSRLKHATHTELERLGYRYDERNPDLLVNFFLSIADRQEIRSTPSASMGGGYYGYRRGGYGAWGSYPYDVETVNYKAGTLSVDLVDARTDSLVWQGLAEGRLKDESIRNPGPAIEAVIAEMFRSFPNPPSN
jgi:Domain of unknown function (DUF4136)